MKITQRSDFVDVVGQAPVNEHTEVSDKVIRFLNKISIWAPFLWNLVLASSYDTHMRVHGDYFDSPNLDSQYADIQQCG